MRRDQLEHAIRAACDVSGDTELLVFGSQAILGSHPLALGELSLFHQTHGFYVHGVSIEAAILPDGWEPGATLDTAWRLTILPPASSSPIVRRIESSWSPFSWRDSSPARSCSNGLPTSLWNATAETRSHDGFEPR